MDPIWIAAGIFVMTYTLIVSERVDRTLVALLGGMAMILAGILPQEQAFEAIDWNVIFLLAGMMILANLLRETGLFQWIAVQAVRLGRDDPFRILIILAVITAVASGLLDNVTIVILVAPVTLIVAANLRVSPMPFLIAEILASNIGGTGTLIGDPPNILIGSAAGFDFLTFVNHMPPVAAVTLLVFLGLCWFRFRKRIVSQRNKRLEIDVMDTGTLITDRKLLFKGVIVTAGVIFGFIAHGVLHIEPATVAFSGATVLLLWSRSDLHHALREVEWVTLFFFIGLFITVEAIVEVGIIHRISLALLNLTGGSLQLTSMLLLWMLAIASGIVDNIPYTATMIPIVQDLGQVMPINPLWWSLALGACLGGNATLVGASANVVVANIATRSGYPIRFADFLRYGLVTTVMSLIIASVYVWVRYLT